MPSNNAKTLKFKSDLNNVAFVVYPGIKLLDLAGPLQVFSDALAANGKPAYRAVVVSLDGVSVQSDTCVSVDCESIVNWKRRKIDTLILVGGKANLDKELRVEHMADKANMSPRHFSRVYQAQTGRTPAKAVEAVRVEAARRLLEDGASSVAMVAQRCGFGDAERMRRAFIRIHKVPPTTFTPS